MKPLLVSLLVSLLLAPAALAGTPTPDPDPSVRPGTPLTMVGYTINLPAYTADGKRLRGWHFRCVYRPHAPRRCRLVRG